MSKHPIRDSIEYALANTVVLFEPARRIATFGETRFQFVLLSEPMDAVSQCRIRSGWVEAQRPEIIRPEEYCNLETEGFSAQGKAFFDWLKARGFSLKALMKYGFRFSRSEVREELLHEDIGQVQPRLLEQTLQADDSLKALLRGVDDMWEVCLLKFTLEMVQKSHEINIFDFRRRGLL
ncbi:MAG: hypothetical protein LUG84_05350 [Akkermansiaceae bacterium]|nr:hypothetical protein [Akkermansia sp.]MCD7798818.1 hypothetical protein [Akkermansiaceae bacterium]MCD8070855.1 hypothetical protein [Akkermansiaceae bacterium]